MHRALVSALCAALVACSSAGDPAATVDPGCPAGTATCRCDLDNACYSQPGQPLICDRGYCVADECVKGTEGCPCFGNGTCAPLDGVPLACQEGVCVARGAEPPPPNCEGPQCGAEALAAGVQSPGARSCEALFDDPDHKIISVAFGAGTRGHELRRGARLGVVFIATDDADLPPDALTLTLAGPLTTPIAPTLVRCFDRLGHPLADASLTLQALAAETTP